MAFRILYAEDRADVAESFIYIAEGGGLEVDHVLDGGPLVEKARSNNYGAIVTDRDMGDMDGFTAIGLIREFDTRTPIWVHCSPDLWGEVKRWCEERSIPFYAKPDEALKLIVELERLARLAQD